jgi:hypothetical protein
MLAAYTNQEEFSAFSSSREHLDVIIHNLLSCELAKQEHSEVEDFIQKEGTELLRKLLQGYLDVRASTEVREQAVTLPEGKSLKSCASKYKTQHEYFVW